MKIYCTFEKVDSHDFLFRVLGKYYGISRRELLYGENGKPFLSGNPVYFSLTHSWDATAVAVGCAPVGLDMEYLKKTRKYAGIFKRLSPDERAEIADADSFYRNWTAKESYIKFGGGSLGEMFDRLSFVRGTLTDGGGDANVKISFFTQNEYLLALCQGRETFAPAELIRL